MVDGDVLGVGEVGLKDQVAGTAAACGGDLNIAPNRAVATFMSEPPVVANAD